jgi:hypothetical protein
MEKVRLVKPQTNETVENVAVYACEKNFICGETNTNGCGNRCGDACPDGINVYSCGKGCPSGTNANGCAS